MRKQLITAIMAMLFVIQSQAYTREDFETIYQNETDQNIKEMGVRQLELELGINTDSDKRTIGSFKRSNCDFCTMTSLINTKKQTVSGRTETDFTMYLSNDNVYDYTYYKEREKDLDLLVAHIGVVKAMTQDLSDIEKAAFIHDYLADRFQYDTEGSINSAVQGFKTGYTECTGYTAAYLDRLYLGSMSWSDEKSKEDFAKFKAEYEAYIKDPSITTIFYGSTINGCLKDGHIHTGLY